MTERVYPQRQFFDIVLAPGGPFLVEDEAGRHLGDCRPSLREDGKIVLRIPSDMVQKETEQ